MNTLKIIALMNAEEHCQDCGAILADLPDATACPHCGLENEPPEKTPVLALDERANRWTRRFWATDTRPEEFFEEVA